MTDLLFALVAWLVIAALFTAGWQLTRPDPQATRLDLDVICARCGHTETVTVEHRCNCEETTWP